MPSASSPTGQPLALHGTVTLALDELIAWGRTLGASLHAPQLLAMSGDLGAGKTTLIKAICAAYGITDPVTSPTFALVHAYQGGPSPVFHLDLHRLNAPSELAALDWDEMLEARAVVFVEWPERAGNALPAHARHITLAHVDGAPDLRRISW